MGPRLTGERHLTNSCWGFYTKEVCISYMDISSEVVWGTIKYQTGGKIWDSKSTSAKEKKDRGLCRRRGGGGHLFSNLSFIEVKLRVKKKHNRQKRKAKKSKHRGGLWGGACPYFRN